MKIIVKLINCLVLFSAVSISAFAEDARKEALIDLGKGCPKLLVSVPSFAQGPYDSAKNKGPVVSHGERLSGGEVMYNAPLSETSVVVYQANVACRHKYIKGDQPVTAEGLASQMLEEEGFKLARAAKIDCPKVPVEGGSIACYKASGHAIFDGKEKKSNKEATVVVGVSFANNTQGYVLMASIIEKNIAAFDKEPEEYVRMAKNGAVNVWKHSQLIVN